MYFIINLCIHKCVTENIVTRNDDGIADYYSAKSLLSKLPGVEPV